MLWDFIVDNNIATEDEVRLVTDIDGMNEQTFLDILYARTGLRSVEQAYDDGCFLSTGLADYYGIDVSDSD